MKSTKAIFSASLAVFIVALSPGLPCYQAFAQTINSRGVPGTPQTPGVPGAVAGPRVDSSMPGAILPSPSLVPSINPALSVEPDATPAPEAAEAAVSAEAQAKAAAAAASSEKPTEQADGLDRIYVHGRAASAAPEPQPAGQPAQADGARLAPAGPAAPQAASVPPTGPKASTSPRVGVRPGSFKYLAMRIFGDAFQWFNRHVTTWDKLPVRLGVLNLAAIQARMRLDNLKDAEAYPNTGYKNMGQPGAGDPNIARTANGTSNDKAAPNMGAAGTRFGDQHVPRAPWTDYATMNPTARDVSNILMKRDKFIPALIVNVLASAWIQFMVHDWMNHQRAPMADKPIKIPLKDGDKWPEKEMTVDRTAPDPTRPADANTPPTYLNSETHWWDLSMVYGSSLETQTKLRSFEGGKLKIGADGRLLEDPAMPGMDLTGFNQNYWLGLSIFHTLFVKEHNAIADALKAKNPDWSDQRLFDAARLVNVALAAKIHTVEWTTAILPNQTLQVGMHADWYGLLGKKFKLWMMDLRTRHPKIARSLKFIADSDILMGATGTPTEHYAAPYAMTNAFTAVYRMHPLLPDEYKIAEHMTGKLLGKLGLTDIQGKHTREVTGQYSWRDIIASFGTDSAGALALNNFPEALRQIKTTDGRLLDLASVDILRERERGMLSYQDFRVMVGKPPVKSFEELAGGNVDLAKKISAVYGGDLSKVDLMVGLFAEKPPEGFGFSDTAFRIFIAMAPRRLKSDRFLSENYNAATYTQLGIDWVEHNTIASMLMRHYPELKASLEGNDNAFRPWQAPLSSNARLVAAAKASSDKLVKSSLINGVLSALAAGLALATGTASVPTLILLAAVPAFMGVFAMLSRLTALGHLQTVSDYSNTGIKHRLFGSLFTADASGKRSALLSKLSALASMDVGGMLMLKLASVNPPVAIAMGLAVLGGWIVWRQTKGFANSMTLARAGLYGTLRAGVQGRPLESLPGATALERHGRYFSGGKEVAKFWTTYKYARLSGLGVMKSFSTAFSWHAFFSAKTQKNMTAEEKAKFKPGRFDNYIPNFVDAQGPTNTRIYAMQDIPGVAKRGDVDMREFERIFREFAVGRDYVTKNDLARLLRANVDRDSSASWLKKFTGKIAFKKRFAQLMIIAADRAVWEDGKLVPAISREQLLRAYEGGLMFDLMDQRLSGADSAD